jgi:hypothetical protein
MSRSYHSLEDKKDICSGPVGDIKKDPSIMITLEKGNHMGDIIIFPVCEKMNRERESSGMCNFNSEKLNKCKYWKMEKEELGNYYNNLKQ